MFSLSRSNVSRLRFLVRVQSPLKNSGQIESLMKRPGRVSFIWRPSSDSRPLVTKSRSGSAISVSTSKPL